VWPTICGKTVLERDQVLMTFFSPAEFMFSTRPRSLASQKGPFFKERDI
jgi:hypothetical protein